jgi:VRR-NUC domain
MSAVQQKDLFTKRWRQVKVWVPSELQIQIALIEHLKYRCRRGVVYFHVPNGELRDKRTAAKLKAMGELPGVADLIFVWTYNGRLENLYLELKAPGRKLSPEQTIFAQRIRAAGACYDIADNIDEALGILRKYGILQ